MNKYFFLIVFFALNISTIKAEKDRNNRNEIALHHFMQGEFLLNQGNFALAVIEFQDALEADPNASTIHVSISDAYRRLGKFKRAEDHLHIAIELDPDEKDARQRLGQLYISNKRYQEAEMKFLELNRLDPYNSEYLVILGDLAKLQYKWNDAIDHYLSAFDINPNVIEPVEQALQISLNAELFYRAEEICNILLEDNPRNEKYWETYRDLTLFNKHYEKSLKAIEMLESLKGVSIKSLLQKSAIQQEFNNVSDALLFLHVAFEKDSVNSDILQRLISIYIENENFNEALIYNEKFIRHFPNDSRGFVNKAILSLNRNSPEEAVLALSSHIEKFQNDYSAQFLLGTAFYQLKDYFNAEIHLIKALKIFPESRNTKHTLALIFDNNGDWIRSDSLYMSLISTDSTDAQAYNNFSFSLVERNDNLELALEMALISNRLQPKSAPYLDTLGWIYFKLQQLEKALEYIKESSEIDNNNPVILEHLADVLKATNQIQKANLIYQQAIEIGGDSLSIQKKLRSD